MTIDLHVDTLWKMTKYRQFDLNDGASFSEISKRSLSSGQLDGVVFPLYLPQSRVKDTTALATQLAYYRNISIEGITKYLAMENGDLLQGKLENLYDLSKDLVYLTLVHNFDNSIGGSSMHIGGGITDFGREVVKACEHLGVLVDISHASDALAWDVLKMATRPVIASHSGCRAITQHPRNLPSTLIREIIATGGIIGVPFAEKFVQDIETLSLHIQHIVDLGGMNNVGIGSDIDGATLVDGAWASNWLNVVLPNLIRARYSLQDVVYITGENTQRLFRRRFRKKFKRVSPEA